MGWGLVDADSAAVSLGVAVPLSIVVTAAIIMLGWWTNPSRHKMGQAPPPELRVHHLDGDVPFDSGNHVELTAQIGRA